MKKVFSLLLALAMLLGLAACGQSAPDPNAGLYEAVSAEMLGITVDVDDIFEDGFSIELKSGGSAVFHYDGKDYRLKWTLDGTSFHAEGGGAELDGTLAGGVMRLLNVLDSGVAIRLECAELMALQPAPAETAAVQPEAAAEADEELSAVESWWSGDWYGWVVLSAAGGMFEEEADTAWDLWGELTLRGEEAELVLYGIEADEDTSSAVVTLSWKPGVTELGRLVSEEGYFLFDPVYASEWVIDPGDSVVSSLENMICITGQYEEDADGDWFNYSIFLRPWGMLWDDVAEADTSDMPYADMMPVHYEEWYLPQLEGAGE